MAAPLALTVSDTRIVRRSRLAEGPEDIPGGHPMTTPIPGGRYGRDQREPPQHLQHEVHSSAATLAGPQGEDADGKVYWYLPVSRI